MSEHSNWDLYFEGLKFNWIFTFRQSDMDAFIKLSNDDSPIHTDFDFVRQLNFKSPLLHGALLATQLSRLIGKEMPDSNAMTIGFSIDFANPAYVDEELSFDATLLHKSESTNILNFEFKILRLETIIARGKISAKWINLPSVYS